MRRSLETQTANRVNFSASTIQPHTPIPFECGPDNCHLFSLPARWLYFVISPATSASSANSEQEAVPLRNRKGRAPGTGFTFRTARAFSESRFPGRKWAKGLLPARAAGAGRAGADLGSSRGAPGRAGPPSPAAGRDHRPRKPLVSFPGAPPACSSRSCSGSSPGLGPRRLVHVQAAAQASSNRCWV